MIDLALACEDWQLEAHLAELFILGYPNDRSHIDFENHELRTDRMFLAGRYTGESPFPYLHTMTIDAGHDLSTFRGLSGAPVFGWFHSAGKRPRIVLCGMAMRGTASAGQIHFLDRSVLLDALAVKRKHERAEEKS